MFDVVQGERRFIEGVMENISLQWEGPFRLDTPDNRSQFHPKDAPGVYLWTVTQRLEHRISFRISYVGQTSSLRNRMHEHISDLLGGKALLFEDGQLHRGTQLTPFYEPPRRSENSFREFLEGFNKHSQLAYMNLVSYRFFWAEMYGHGGRQGSLFRRAVESALIVYAKYPLQNNWRKGSGGVSLLQKNSPKVRIESDFSKAEGLREVVQASMDYGDKQDSQGAAG